MLVIFVRHQRRNDENKFLIKRRLDRPAFAHANKIGIATEGHEYDSG